MNGIEEIIFEIISNSGEARSILMDVIQRAEKGDFEQSEVKINEAEKRLKNAQKAHFKIITSEAKKDSSPLVCY
nr:PTS lactose/cellobiose transporter subunit IIA [Liquorilactobacillus vini]